MPYRRGAIGAVVRRIQAERGVRVTKHGLRRRTVGTHPRTTRSFLIRSTNGTALGQPVRRDWWRRPGGSGRDGGRIRDGKVSVPFAQDAADHEPDVLRPFAQSAHEVREPLTAERDV